VSLLQLRFSLGRDGGTRVQAAGGRRKGRGPFAILFVIIIASAVGGFALSQWLTENERVPRACCSMSCRTVSIRSRARPTSSSRRAPASGLRSKRRAAQIGFGRRGSHGDGGPLPTFARGECAGYGNASGSTGFSGMVGHRVTALAPIQCRPSGGLWPFRPVTPGGVAVTRRIHHERSRQGHRRHDYHAVRTQFAQHARFDLSPDAGARLLELVGRARDLIDTVLQLMLQQGSGNALVSVSHCESAKPPTGGGDDDHEQNAKGPRPLRRPPAA